MRAREFVSESFQKKEHGKPSSLSQQVNTSLPGVFVQRQLRNTDPYMQYRYGMAVAASRAIQSGELPADSFSQESAFAENLTQVMFAPEDQETIKLASQLMGTDATEIADPHSHESSDVNSKSPVAKKRINRFGV